MSVRSHNSYAASRVDTGELLKAPSMSSVMSTFENRRWSWYRTSIRTGGCKEVTKIIYVAFQCPLLTIDSLTRNHLELTGIINPVKLVTFPECLVIQDELL